jgi:2-dehydro-3-deoxygluconokinase
MTGVRALRPATSCGYDVVALGEIMLRLDPGNGRIRTARNFRVWEGGGEYNVARGLRRCFGQRSAVVTALADNDIGRLIEDLVLQGGVSPDWIQWREHDGVGRSCRNGLNFTERGFGARGANGVSDRGHTAASQLRPGDVDWERLFGEVGVRWLHTGGIFAGLSDTTADVAEEALRSAHAYGTIVSYDLNYRPSIWQAAGGEARAREVNARLAPLIDVMVGNESDFATCLGFDANDIDGSEGDLDTTAFRDVIRQVRAAFPNIHVVATSLRRVQTATRNDWGGVAWSADEGFVEAVTRYGLDVLDRVGGGDSFAGGLIYGLLAGEPLQAAVEYGAAHGALAMTTPGDTSMASLAEVLALMAGDRPRVRR